MQSAGTSYLKLVVDNSRESGLRTLQADRILSLVGQIYGRQDMVELWHLCQEMKSEPPQEGYFEFALKFRSVFGHLFDSAEKSREMVRSLELINIFTMLVYLRFKAGKTTLQGVTCPEMADGQDRFGSDLDELGGLIELAIHGLFTNANRPGNVDDPDESMDLRHRVNSRVNSV